MFELKPYYEGTNFSVYILDLKGRCSLSLFPVIIERFSPVIKWQPDSNFLPNCLTSRGELGYTPDLKIPDNVYYADDLDEEEWLPIEPFLEPCLICFRRPLKFQKVFYLKIGKFVVPKADTYPQAINNKEIIPEYKPREILADLDKYGIVVERLTLSPFNLNECIAYTSDGIPVSIALKYNLIKHKLYTKISLLEEVPIEQQFESTVPLYWNHKDNSRQWVADHKHLLWISKNVIEISPEAAQKKLGIKTNKTLLLVLTPEHIDEYWIPIEIVEEIIAHNQVFITANNCTTKNLKYLLQWAEVKPGKINLKVESIKLKKPLINKCKKFGFIGCLEDLQKFMKSEEITKITPNIDVREEFFELYYLHNGNIKKIPGKYCYKKDIRPSRAALKEKYNKVLTKQKLNYLLPGDPLDWKIEDLITYDRLMRTGNYAHKPIIQIGMYQYHANPILEEVFAYIENGVYTFESNEIIPKTVVLYKKITPLEAVQVLKSLYKNNPINQFDPLVSTLKYIIEKGFPLEYAQEILDKFFGLNRKNDKKENYKPEEIELEIALKDLASLDVSDEALIEVFNTALGLPEINLMTILVENQTEGQ